VGEALLTIKQDTPQETWSYFHLSYGTKSLIPTITSKCGGALQRYRCHYLKKTKLGSKMVDCIFSYNSSVYSFIIHKSEILDIHVKHDYWIKRCYVLWRYLFVQTERNKTSGGETHKTTFRDEGFSEPTFNSEVEPGSKRLRISKSFGPNFVTYVIESGPQTFKHAMPTPKAQIWKEGVIGS